MKYNSEAIHDSFSEFKFCHAVNLRRTGSFIRLIISKSKRRNLIFWVLYIGISSVPVILTLEWNDLPDDELQLREDSWSLLGI